MLASSGYWSRSQWLQEAAKRVAEEKRRAARARKAHRALPASVRLVADLDKVRDKMRALDRVCSSERALSRYGRGRALAEQTRYLKQWNRLVRALNKYNGTSQQVREES